MCNNLMIEAKLHDSPVKEHARKYCLSIVLDILFLPNYLGAFRKKILYN